jgi:hypothetical protein
MSLNLSIFTCGDGDNKKNLIEYEENKMRKQNA